MLLIQVRHEAQLRRGAFGGKTPELLEAEVVAVRLVMQLAGDGGVIAVVAKDGGQEDLAVVRRHGIGGDAGHLRIATGEYGGPGG